jgi:zinc transporter
MKKEMQKNVDHILLAYGFDGKGGGYPLLRDAVSKSIKDDKLAWVHLDVNNPDTKKWLKKEVPYLDKYILDALLEDETRPRMQQFEDGALMILRGVNLNENAEPEDMISIRLWIDKHRIISLQRRQLKAVFDIEKKLLDGKGPKDSGDFISFLSADLFKRMEPVLSDLDDETDDSEEQILDNPDIALRKAIIDIRMRAIMLRRYIAPQRDAIAQLKMTDLKWLDEENKRHLQESYNSLTRYVEDLDAIRERAQIVKDELTNILADKLNKNMYVLSVIAAIFLPLGFLTGLLGINIGGIPGAENPNAFWFFCAGMSVIVTIQIFIFKKLKWF